MIQTADLGAHSGALEVRFIRKPGVRRAFINTPGTNAIWLADDDDRDGVFEFQQVLGPDDGLVLPADMLLSYDEKHMYVTNWFGNTVQQFDIRDPVQSGAEGLGLRAAPEHAASESGQHAGSTSRTRC